MCCWCPLAFLLSRHLVTLHQELHAQSQLQGEMKITWIVQTYSVCLCCTPKHSSGLQDTSNCWCGDACPDKLFLENNQLGSNLVYWCQIPACAYIVGSMGSLILLTSPQCSSIFACYYQIGLVNVVYSAPELSPLNVRWEQWLCILVHVFYPKIVGWVLHFCVILHSKRKEEV